MTTRSARSLARGRRRRVRDLITGRLRGEPLEDRRVLATLGPTAISGASFWPVSAPVAEPASLALAGNSSSNTLVAAATTAPSTAAAGSLAGSTQSPPFTPAEIAHAYGFDDLYFPTPGSPGTFTKGDGTGQTIAIVDPYNQPNIVSDLHAFDATFGLPDPQLTIVNELGQASNLPNNAPKSGNQGIEISLDVEWAHALAPGAKILLVETTNLTNANLNLGVSTAAHSGAGVFANLPAASIVSMSYGGTSVTSQDNTNLYSTPATKAGVTFIASSGDSGALGLYPGSDPNVLGVGGTSLTIAVNGNYGGEVAWSGSNGGPSPNPQLSYQANIVPFGGANPGVRMSPDVAFDGDLNTGVYVYDTYDGSVSSPWFQVGGTSLSAPSWAALIADANQARGAAGPLNTLQTLADLYATYTNGAYSYDFHDVTSGQNNNYSAGPGYDYVTGLGSPRANLVAATLAGIGETPTPLGPTGITTTATPTFQWSTIGGAQGYYLSIVDTTTQATIASNLTVTGTSYTPSSPLPIGDTLQWQVQAFDSTGAFAPASSPVTFSVVIPNHAPTGADNTVTTPENTPYRFATSDFGFSDPDDNPPNNFLAVDITTLPVLGVLADNGTPVIAGQFIAASDIATGWLTFTPAVAGSGANYTSFTFQVEDDGGTANGGAAVDPLPKTMTISVTPDTTPPVIEGVFVDGTDWTPDFFSALQTAGLGDGGYLLVPGAAAANQDLPWSDLNQIKIVFSENVNVQAGSLTLTGVAGDYSPAQFSYDAGNFTATWTLAAPVGADRLQLVVHSSGPAAVTDLAGNPLDGEFPGSAANYPTGDGLAGGDFQSAFNVLPGDVNDDQIVNIADLTYIGAHWLVVGIAGDANGDDLVNIGDLTAVGSSWLQSLPESGDSTTSLAAEVTVSPEPANESAASAGLALGAASPAQLVDRVMAEETSFSPDLLAAALLQPRTSASGQFRPGFST